MSKQKWKSTLLDTMKEYEKPKKKKKESSIDFDDPRIKKQLEAAKRLTLSTGPRK